jgi:hypothetical protein
METVMINHKEGDGTWSRRSLLKGSAALVAGGVLGGAMTTYAGKRKRASTEPPPLPWKWAKLDPLEAGRRAYRNYFVGGCGHATYTAFVSLLREKVGYPWTTLPDKMMIHAAAGYGGHGTLCGTLGGTSVIINLVAYTGGDERVALAQAPTPGAHYRQIVDRLFYWYAEQEFPPNRFDDISAFPKQVKAKAMSPLCHTSVTKWTLAAGAEISSKAKKERCAKVAGEVAYITTLALNEYFDGKWTPPAWKPSKETEHCVDCHGPADMQHNETSMNQQQGHMECLMCHDDHTK